MRFNRKQWTVAVLALVFVAFFGGVLVPTACGVNGTPTGFFMAIAIGFISGPIIAVALLALDD